MPSPVSAFVAPWLDVFRPLIATGLEPAWVAERVTAAVRDELAWTDDLERARLFRDEVPVDGTVPADYRPRLVSVGPSREVLVGIQFRGPGPIKPVLEVSQRSFAIDRPELLTDLLRCLGPHFAVFRPSAVLVFLSPAEEAACGGAIGIPDERLIGAGLDYLRRQPRPPAPRRVRLEPTEDLDFFDEYSKAYESFHSRAGAVLRESVRVETRETLTSFMRHGAVFQTFVDDAWAGIAAVARGSLKGLPGFIVVEEVLAERFRGQRLAPVVQYELLQRLETKPGDCLFGRIHPLNLSSMRTAMGRGRLDLGGSRALPLP